MDEPRKARLRSAINSRIQALTDQVRDSAVSDVGEEGSQVDSRVDVEVELAVLQSARRELRLLQENLSWLEDEDGGYCEECGCEIKTARLLVVPSTRLCVACASNRESSG